MNAPGTNLYKDEETQPGPSGKSLSHSHYTHVEQYSKALGGGGRDRVGFKEETVFAQRHNSNFGKDFCSSFRTPTLALSGKPEESGARCF